MLVHCRLLGNTSKKCISAAEQAVRTLKLDREGAREKVMIRSELLNGPAAAQSGLVSVEVAQHSTRSCGLQHHRSNARVFIDASSPATSVIFRVVGDGLVESRQTSPP